MDILVNETSYRQQEESFYLANSSLEVFIACGDDIASVLLAALDKTIIGICASVTARNSLKARVFCKSQRETVPFAKFFQLCHDAISDARDAFRQKTVHHRLIDF